MTWIQSDDGEAVNLDRITAILLQPSSSRIRSRSRRRSASRPFADRPDRRPRRARHAADGRHAGRHVPDRAATRSPAKVIRTADLWPRVMAGLAPSGSPPIDDADGGHRAD
jgi:hypothetical protein